MRSSGVSTEGRCKQAIMRFRIYPALRHAGRFIRQRLKVMICTTSTVVGRVMSLVRHTLLSFAALALFAGPAEAQTYWGNFIETRSGEIMGIVHAYVGDRPNASYPYEVIGALRSRPEGYFWQQFRTTCDGSSGSSSSWGFVRWEDRAQLGGQRDGLFGLLPEGIGEALAREIQCNGMQGAGSVEGRAAVLSGARAWQREAP